MHTTELRARARTIEALAELVDYVEDDWAGDAFFLSKAVHKFVVETELLGCVGLQP